MTKTSNHRNVTQLLEQYKPLIFSVYKKRNYAFRTELDKEDFLSQLHFIFTNLVYEYNPERGVDFPFYIKRMLELRAGHYITKYIKQKTRETTLDPDIASYNQDKAQREELGQLDDLLDDDMMDVLNIESWNEDGVSLGSKQEKLFLGILRDDKTLKELAKEENVSISTIHTRMHFLTKKIRERQATEGESWLRGEGIN